MPEPGTTTKQSRARTHQRKAVFQMDTTFQKQYPIALTAIAVHIQTHHLPAPLDIFVIDTVDGGRLGKAIRLHLPGQHTHQAWVDSVEVDGVETEPADSGHGTRMQWFVRLPDTGIRLQLVGYRHSALIGIPA